MSELKIKKVERSEGRWFTIAINENLKVDLSTSLIDKRDWIISKREGTKLEQDKGFISVHSRKTWTMTELLAELLRVAKEMLESVETETPKPTLEQKIDALKKSLRSMRLQYEYANGKMGRKSWKSVADFFYNQTQSLEDLLNDKGFLYGLLCEQSRTLENASAVDHFSSARSNDAVSK